MLRGWCFWCGVTVCVSDKCFVHVRKTRLDATWTRQRETVQGGSPASAAAAELTVQGWETVGSRGVLNFFPRQATIHISRNWRSNSSHGAQQPNHVCLQSLHKEGIDKRAAPITRRRYSVSSTTEDLCDEPNTAAAPTGLRTSKPFQRLGPA